MHVLNCALKECIAAHLKLAGLWFVNGNWESGRFQPIAFNRYQTSFLKYRYNQTRKKSTNLDVRNLACIVKKNSLHNASLQETEVKTFINKLFWAGKHRNINTKIQTCLLFTKNRLNETQSILRHQVFKEWTVVTKIHQSCELITQKTYRINVTKNSTNDK